MDNFKDWGYTFQIKILVAMLTDVRFLAKSYDIIRSEYFESDALRWVNEYILNYYNEYRSAPTQDAFKVALLQLEDITEQTAIVSVLDAIYLNIGASDIEYVKDKAHTFCKHQELKYAIWDCAELVSNNKLELVKDRIDDALRRGEGSGDVYDYYATLVDRYSVKNRPYIETGWPCLNEIIKGGLGPGELGVIAGPGGSGKSWALQHITSAAVKVGKHALYITMELMEPYVASRLDTIFSGIPTMNIPNEIKRIREIYEALTGKLSVKWFPEDTLTINGMRAFVDKMVMLNNKPDIIIVDYADLMQLPDNRDRTDQKLKKLYQQLRGYAGELMIPIWTASQTTRDSYSEDVIGADKLSESIGKHHTADLMLSLTRRDTDKVSGTAKYHVVKNRLGPDGMTFVSTMDTVRGIIELYPPRSKQAKNIIAKMEEGEEQASRDLVGKLEHHHAVFTEQ